MKLTDELKGKLENADSDEEAKKIIAETKKGVEEAGLILDDAELDQVSGGYWVPKFNYDDPNYGCDYAPNY